MVNPAKPARRQGIREFWQQMHPAMRRLIAIGLVEMLALGLYVSLISPWYKSLGYEASEQGLLNSILEIAGMIAGITGGILADRYGRKVVYTIGQLMRCAAIIMLLCARSFAGLVIVSVFRGLNVMQFPARTALIAGYTAKESRATVLGVYQTVVLVANIAAPLAAGIMADLYGISPPLLLALALAVLAIILSIPIGQTDDSSRFLQRVHESPAQDSGLPGHQPGSTSAQPASQQSRPQPKRGKVILETLIAAGRELFEQSDKRILTAMLMAFTINGLVNGGINILLPFTVMDRFSTEFTAVAGLSVISSLGTALVMLVGGRIADLRGRRGIILVTGIITPLLILLIFWVNKLWQLYALLMLVSMVGNLASPGIVAAKMEAVDEAYRASWDGLVQGATSAGLALGSAASGMLYALSPTWAWLAVIILCGFQIVCWYVAFTPKHPLTMEETTALL